MQSWKPTTLEKINTPLELDREGGAPLESQVDLEMSETFVRW